MGIRRKAGSQTPRPHRKNKAISYEQNKKTTGTIRKVIKKPVAREYEF